MALPSPATAREQVVPDEQHAPKASKAGAHKTAYFLYSEENRQDAKVALLAEKGPDAKVSAAEVAKELGRRWKLLSEDERAGYKTRCQEAHAAQAAAAPSQPGGSQGQGEDAAKDSKQTGAAQPKGLPITAVKRIACLDEDVGRISHDAVLALAHATELFLELLTDKCCHVMNTSKPRRSTMKLSDFGEVLKRDRRLVTAGLRDVLTLAQQHADKAAETRAAEHAAKAVAAADPDTAGQGEHVGETGGDKAAANGKPKTPAGDGKLSKRQRVEQAIAATRPITSFFAKPKAS